MKTLGSKLALVALMATLGIIGTLMSSPQAAVQGATGPVVTLDPTQLPLPVKVSSNVSGTVAATQSGSWNVGVQGTPNVKDADLPARHFVSFEFFSTYAPTYTVPAGKILVIEWVSATGIPAGGELGLSFDGDTGSLSNTHRWSAYFAPVPGSSAIFQQVRLYAKGGQTISLAYSAGTPQLFIQGYLIDET